MKISESWLREWVKPALTTEELVEQLTMAGLEVDGCETVGASLEGVVVAEISAVESHPDADKLRVCQVSRGASSVQIVCGAANARVGIKIPLATVGSVLPGGMKIKAAKLRGVESHGMLCAADELGLGGDHDGIWELPANAEVGQPLASLLALPDTILELDLTPNRSDCLSVAGVARDVGVISREALTPPSINDVAPTIEETFAIELQAGEHCPRYLGRVIRNVDLTKSAPLWMQQRLERAGMRSIDAAVDVTNYVMLELGQPMHAFDLNSLQGGIVVRTAAAGEKIVLLDGTELALKEDSLLIADQNKPLALAGIMGGEGSGVKADTTDIMLEAAFFAPLKIAGRARSFGLHTESSHRFERGVDPEAAEQAMQRATQLLLDIVGGDAGPINRAESTEHIPQPVEIALRRRSIKRILGFEMADSEVEDILQRLGLQLESLAEGWSVTCPTFRFDLQIEADLLEELARIYGYNRLPSTVLYNRQSFKPEEEQLGSVAGVRAQMVGRGYQEAITYSFIDPELQSLYFDQQSFVKVQNPISSEMSVMRTSLIPGLVQALSHNVKRQQQRVRLFEVGQCFVPGESTTAMTQNEMLAGVICGARSIERWSHGREPVDFYDIKGDVESLLTLHGHGDERSAAGRNKAGSEASFKLQIAAAEHPAMHPGQCAAISLNGVVIGHVGALHPRLQSSLDLPSSVFVFELALNALLQGILPSYEKISKFPEVRRDLAILIKEEISMSVVGELVKASAGDILIGMKVFDVYSGKGVPEGEKSVGLGLTLQDQSRTLTEEDVNASLDQIITKLQEELRATLRN